MVSTEQKTAIKGGEFLVRETEAHEIFIPEEFTEEQRMMAQACEDFLRTEIHTKVEEMDSTKDTKFMRNAMEKAGELGLLGVSVPEEYNGLGMSFNTSMLIADVVGSGGSFSTAYGAHTGIGTLPILLYGNEEQKKKYVSKLSTGEWMACYCLTEPDAGSDANSGKTKAKLSEDGKHYIITGQKMWISNGGFADLLIVFAKIDDDKNLTAFIAERTYEGITMNEEEKKLGIKGSSTRQVFFNDCKVPVENMLSTRGNGFKIAVNVLNVGRIKLGVGVLGGTRLVTTSAIQYAKQRKQFNTPIANFGAIKHKLAEMATKIFVTESLSYRAGQNIDDNIAELSKTMSDSDAKLRGVEQFAIECAIAKVHGSETLDFVVDEGVQIYGGMGFSEDAPMARAYRDARISRIYEGTNEINRMLLIGMIVKRAMKGELDMFAPAMAVAKELTSVPSFETVDASVLFAEEKQVLKNMKKAVLMVAGDALQSLGEKFESEQELMMNLADMVIEVYAVESAILRTEKLVSIKGEAACEQYINMTKVYLASAVDRLEAAGREAINSYSQGDKHKVLLMGLKRFTKLNPVNTTVLRRSIADAMIAEGRYNFSTFLAQ
jgi:alkylation response protein AidB-like acyl-CoA dehydrogenase